MGAIALHRKLTKLNAELPKLIEESISELDNEIISIIQSQLFDSKIADGRLMPTYSPNTVAIKKERGGFISKTGRWALYNYGDFFNKMYAKVSNGKLLIGSNDEKMQMIEAMMLSRMGDNADVLMYGITNENKPFLAKAIAPILYKKITDFLKQA